MVFYSELESTQWGQKIGSSCQNVVSTGLCSSILLDECSNLLDMIVYVEESTHGADIERAHESVNKT